MKCDAFPDQIPFHIFIGELLHYEHFSRYDDHGILFEPIDDGENDR
jgi:hypothetical protein